MVYDMVVGSTWRVRFLDSVSINLTRLIMYGYVLLPTPSDPGDVHVWFVAQAEPVSYSCIVMPLSRNRPMELRPLFNRNAT